MIKELLEYQNKEREKLTLRDAVEGGKAKRELDDANRTIENAKKMLLNLENDAKALLAAYDSIANSMKESFEKISAYNKSKKADASNEEETAAELSFVSGLLSKISAAESQLNDIAAKINAKTNAFEDAKTQVVKAQKHAMIAAGMYENEKKAASPKIEKIDAELKQRGNNIKPAALLEKYKQIRKNKPKGDIVVHLNGNRCGGCHFELPLSLIHTVSNQGYIICEECGKIIYK